MSDQDLLNSFWIFGLSHWHLLSHTTRLCPLAGVFGSRDFEAFALATIKLFFPLRVASQKAGSMTSFQFPALVSAQCSSRRWRLEFKLLVWTPLMSEVGFCLGSFHAASSAQGSHSRSLNISTRDLWGLRSLCTWTCDQWESGFMNAAADVALC